MPQCIAGNPFAQTSHAHWAYRRTALCLRTSEEGHKSAMGFAGADAGVPKTGEWGISMPIV
jgi:hypothetical protein